MITVEALDGINSLLQVAANFLGARSAWTKRPAKGRYLMSSPKVSQITRLHPHRIVLLLHLARARVTLS